MILLPSTTRLIKQFAWVNCPELIKCSPIWSLFIQLLDSSSSLAGFHYSKLVKFSPTILVFSITRYFKQFGLLHQPHTHRILSYYFCSLNYKVIPAAQLRCSTLNSLKLLLRSLFLLVLSCSSSSVGLNYLELMKYSPMILLPLITRKFKLFNRVGLHRTHEIFFYAPCSLNYSVVQPVRLGWDSLKSWNILLSSLFLWLLGNSSSLAGLNYLELMKYSLTILVPSIIQ